MSGSWSPEELPNLRESDHEIKSKATIAYNCFAWAAEETHRRWDPYVYHWPKGVRRELTMEAFVEAYSTKGYELCDTPDREAGFQKIAIYADSQGIPTHAARQLDSGKWTSKIGEYEDIDHESLECIEGDGELCYGRAAKYMKRRIP